MQSEAEARSQNCSSFEYVENTMASKPLPAWEGDGAAAETQVRRDCQEGTLHLLGLSVKNDLLNHCCGRVNVKSNSLWFSEERPRAHSSPFFLNY